MSNLELLKAKLNELDTKLEDFESSATYNLSEFHNLMKQRRMIVSQIHELKET